MTEDWRLARVETPALRVENEDDLMITLDYVDEGLIVKDVWLRIEHAHYREEESDD